MCWNCRCWGNEYKKACFCTPVCWAWGGMPPFQMAPNARKISDHGMRQRCKGAAPASPVGVFRSARAFSYPQSFVGGQNWVCGSSWVSSLSSSPHTLQSLCLHGHIIIWVGWTHCYFWEENQKEVGRETKRCEKENTHLMLNQRDCPEI